MTDRVEAMWRKYQRIIEIAIFLLSISTNIAGITVYYTDVKLQKVHFESEINRVEAKVDNHLKSDVHMRYGDKIKTFVTRDEYSKSEGSADKRLESIESKLDEIYRYLRDNK